MTKVCNNLLLTTKSSAVCAPTVPVCVASPGRQGWNADARELPAALFSFSQKAPAAGYDGDSRKLRMEGVKQVRDETGIEYAKIGQCNEDQLNNRRRDGETYPPHIYDKDESDAQQEGEDDKAHQKRLKFLWKQRLSAAANESDHPFAKRKRSATPVVSPISKVVRRSTQQVPWLMERDAKPNRASRPGRVQVHHRHHPPPAWPRPGDDKTKRDQLNVLRQ